MEFTPRRPQPKFLAFNKYLAPYVSDFHGNELTVEAAHPDMPEGHRTLGQLGQELSETLEDNGRLLPPGALTKALHDLSQDLCLRPNMFPVGKGNVKLFSEDACSLLEAVVLANYGLGDGQLIEMLDALRNLAPEQDI